MPEDEAASIRLEKAKELLRSGRLVFLQTTGYSSEEILKLGDLASVSSEKVNALLERKILEAAARFFDKENVETELLKKKEK